MNYRVLANTTLDIAKGLAPIQTGNLRHNAISIRNFRKTKDGAKWVIHYSPRDAHYLEPLITGRRNKKGERVTGRRYFVEIAALNIGTFISKLDLSKSSVPKDKFTKSLSNESTSTKDDNDARKLLHLKSVDLYDKGLIKPNFANKREVYKF